MQRFSTPLRFAALVMSLTFTACSHAGQHTAGSDTLRIAVQQEARTLNPILASNTVDTFVQRFMFEPLVSADPQGNPVPMLAAAVPTVANGGISRDGRTVTYRLRPNARWSDGVPVTSSDVRFSWNAIVSGANNAVARHGYDDVTAIDARDARVAVVHLRKPLASFVNTFFAESDQPYSLVPEHALAKYPNLNQIAFNASPTVTDGPFKFQSWTHGDRIVLVANDAFFMGKPHLRRVIIRIVPDENTSVSLLRTREIDYMYQPSIATYPTLKAAPGVHTVWVNMNGYEGIVLNSRRKPLDNPKVRDAIAYAIDKAQIVRSLTYGNARVANADLPDWLWAANPAIVSRPRDVARARRLLREAGIAGPIALTIVSETANVTHKREAVLIQSMLKDVGINAQLKTYPGDLLYAPAGGGGILNSGNFDIDIWPWYAGIDPDNSSQFSCESIPPGGWNEARYCNPEMEREQQTALSTNDRAARIAAYHRIESLVARDNPIVPIWWQRQQEALSVDLKGFAPNPVNEDWNAWEWEL